MVELRTAQKLFLKKVEESRKLGNTKGLLIFATGIGKTLASLSDALRIAGNKGKILVLAHNHNLLFQHAKDFKLLNKEKKIGFLYQSIKDTKADILFANIMTIKQRKYIEQFKRDEFDYIIIDETHHAGAKSYKIIFDYFNPKFLLGMTATPRRTDQIDILPLYDNNIIMKVDTYEAINKGWLRPYDYIFLWDKWCDYEKVKSYKLNNGYFKYDVAELGKAYYVPERDKAIVEEFKKRAVDRKGIGFCASVSESIRMAKLFNDNGIKSVAVWGASRKDMTMNEKKRNKILEDYSNGKYQMLFNCDIIGEGLHFPSVDVVLKLRPTQSSIKDNQHNGRGLYNIEGLEINSNKYEKLLILDWVGNYAHAYENYIYQGKQKEYDQTKVKDIRQMIELPIGCNVEFEERVIEDWDKEINKKNILHTKEELIKKYNQLRNKLSREPTHIELMKEITPYNIIKHFDSYQNFYKEVGRIKPKIKNLSIQDLNMTKEDKFNNNLKEIIDSYYKLKEELGRVPTRYELTRYTNKEISYYLQRSKYGFYRNFLKEIGDSKSKKIKITEKKKIITDEDRKKELIEKYFKCKEKLGRVPKTFELVNNSFSMKKMYKNYGLYKNFLIAMGDYKEKEVKVKEVKQHLTMEEKFKLYYKDKMPTRNQLRCEHNSIYHYFRKNKLLSKYCRQVKNGGSIRKEDSYYIEKLNELFPDRKPSPSEVGKKNYGLYIQLWKRKLVDKCCIRKNLGRGYKKMSDEELIKEGGKLISKNKIESAGDFCLLNQSLSTSLRDRNIFWKVLNKNGIFNLNYQSGLDIELIKRLYSEGKSTRQIGKLVGYSGSQVRLQLKKNGIILRKNNLRILKDKDIELIKKKYLEEKKSITEVNKELNISRGVIRRIMEENGIILRNQKENAELNINNKGRFSKKNNISKEIRLRNSIKSSIKSRKLLGDRIDLFKKIYGDRKPFKEQLRKENNKIYSTFKKYNLLNSYCNYVFQHPNIKITSSYKPKIAILRQKVKRKGLHKTYQDIHKEEFKSKEDKVEIREKIISKINDGDNILLLESPELSTLKEIEKQNKKPSKIVITNNKEFNKIVEALRNYKTNLNIELINTSALQYLIDSEEKFDFIWLDYCGAFSFYMKDLDILFQKHFNSMKLILTYNLFDPIKEDDSYYFTRVIDYVLDKVSGRSGIRLINDITNRYKKNMYNIGFKIEEGIYNNEK